MYCYLTTKFAKNKKNVQSTCFRKKSLKLEFLFPLFSVFGGTSKIFGIFSARSHPLFGLESCQGDMGMPCNWPGCLRVRSRGKKNLKSWCLWLQN